MLEYGLIDERIEKGNTFVDPKGRAPVHFSVIMRKLSLTQEQVLETVSKFNIPFDTNHFNEPEVKKGRPKKSQADNPQLKPQRTKKATNNIQVDLPPKDQDLLQQLSIETRALTPRQPPNHLNLSLQLPSPDEDDEDDEDEDIVNDAIAIVKDAKAIDDEDYEDEEIMRLVLQQHESQLVEQSKVIEIEPVKKSSIEEPPKKQSINAIRAEKEAKKAREAKEKEAKEKEAKEAREAKKVKESKKAKEAREKEAKEKEAKEKEAREKEAREKEAREKESTENDEVRQITYLGKKYLVDQNNVAYDSECNPVGYWQPTEKIIVLDDNDEDLDEEEIDDDLEENSDEDENEDEE